MQADEYLERGRDNRSDRPIPTRSYGVDPRLHQGEGGFLDYSLSPSFAGGYLRGNLRCDGVSGAGYGSGQARGGLYARRRRHSQASHGKEEARGDGQAARDFCQGSQGNQRHRQEEGGRDLRYSGEVCRLRFQQVALRGLRNNQLPDGLPEGEPPCGLYGGGAFLRARKCGKTFPLHRGMFGDGNLGARSGRERIGGKLHSRSREEGR